MSGSTISVKARRRASSRWRVELEGVAGDQQEGGISIAVSVLARSPITLRRLERA